MKPSPLKRSSPLRKVSPRRAKENRAYSKLRKEFLEEHPWCEVCVNADFGIGRINPSTETHHLKGREGKYLTDTKFFMAICSFHHSMIHDNPQWAMEQGYLLPRR